MTRAAALAGVPSAAASRALAAAALCFGLVLPRIGRAQEVAGVDVSAIETGAHGKWGLGVDGRLGYLGGLPRAWIVHNVVWQLEVVGGYKRLPASGGDVGVGSVGGGLRLGLFYGPVQGVGFVHGRAATMSGDWGPMVDAGAALDWRFSAWSVGLHYVHDWLFAPLDKQQLNELGLHVEIRGFWL